MQCLQCKKEFQAIRETAKFCSAYCRVAYSRSVSSSEVSVSKNVEVSVSSSINDTLKTKQEVSVSTPEIIMDKETTLSKMTAEELYMGINSYPGNTWADSVEYIELIRRLETLSVKQLRDQGFWVPAWKLNGAKKKPVLTT